MSASHDPAIAESTRAVLFDLDGTLLDTAPDMAGALNQLRSEEGRGALPFAMVRSLVSHGSGALVSLGFPGVVGSEFEALRARLSLETQIYDGIQEALVHLESMDILWGIVTNKPGWLTEPLLEDLSLRHRARVVVSGDTLAERKPHPAPLLHAAGKLGLAPRHCVYVGDAERDVLAARAAGMKVYVALFGYIPENERPRDWPAEGWLESPLDMARWLRSLRA